MEGLCEVAQDRTTPNSKLNPKTKALYLKSLDPFSLKPPNPKILHHTKWPPTGDRNRGSATREGKRVKISCVGFCGFGAFLGGRFRGYGKGTCRVQGLDLNIRRVLRTFGILPENALRVYLEDSSFESYQASGWG